jgi:hypothetical protein
MEVTMRFMCMHKVDAKMEAGERPSQELIQKMGQFVGRHLKAGVFLDGAGLHRSAARARVSFGADGQATVERGPFAGKNELLARFALITTPGIEQAIERATELGQAAGRCDVEVGPVVEGWDLNGSPRPADAPYRFLLLVKADVAFETGAAAPKQVRQVLDRWKAEGVLTSDTTLKPTTSSSARTRVANGKRFWVDGPFAESKELVAGFSILELPSLAAAKELCEEYAAILGDNEVDIREVDAQ